MGNCHIHNTRYIVNSNQHYKNSQIAAPRSSWSRWFEQATNNGATRGRLTYAQALKNSSTIPNTNAQSTSVYHRCHTNKGSICSAKSKGKAQRCPTNKSQTKFHNGDLNNDNKLVIRPTVRHIPTIPKSNLGIQLSNRFAPLLDIQVNQDYTQNNRVLNTTSCPTKAETKTRKIKQPEAKFVKEVKTHASESQNGTIGISKVSQQTNCAPNADSIAMVDMSDDVDQIEVGASVENTRKIPAHIWEDRLKSRDYVNFMNTTGGRFGFIPLSDLTIYEGAPTNNEYRPIWEAHKAIRRSGVPNFMACRIPVKSQLNPAVFRSKLLNY